MTASYALPAGVVVLLVVTLSGVACAKPQSPAPAIAQDPLQAIPANWIDLPDAPFVARIVDQRAVLINRTKQTFDRMTVGCVRPVDGVVTTIHQLFGQQVSDGSWVPGARVENLLAMVNNIDFYIADEQRVRRGLLKQCPAGTHVAVTSAGFGEQHRWKAEGTRWPR